MITRKTVFTTLLITVSVFFSNNVLSADYINDARQYLEQGNYQAAMIQLKNQLKQNPKDAQARYLLGIVYLKSDNVKGAEKELSTAYKLDKNNEKIQLEYAKILLLKGEYQEVKELLAQPLIEKENESERLMTIGSAYLGEQKIADARDYFSQAKKVKDTPNVQLGFVKIALLEKEFKTAETIIEQILQQTPDNYDALLLKAQLANQLGQYQKAQSIYDDLLAKKPGSLLLLLSRAQTKYNLKEYKGAEEDLNLILKSIENFPQANYLMALVKFAQEDFTAAEQYGQQVLNVATQHYQSMYIIGLADFNLGRLNQAEKYFTQILFQYPDNLNVQYALARIYLSQNKADQALLILESIKLDSLNKNPKVLLILAKAYFMADKKEKSKEVFNRVKKLAPDEPLVIESLAQLQLFLGNVDNAIKELEKLDILENKNKNIQYLLIMSYIKGKKFEKAKNLIVQLQKQSLDDPNLYTFYGDIAFIENNQEIASQSYQKALAIDEKFIPAYLGLSKMALFNKQLDEADGYLQNILSIDEQYLNAYLGRVAIAEKMGKTTLAEKILTEGINKISDDLDKELSINNALAKLYIKHNRKNELLKFGRELVKKYPRKTQALSFQVKVLLLNGEKKQAQMVLEKIIYQEPKDIKHRLQLAALLLNNNEQQAAVNLLDEILENNPGHQQTVLLKSSLLINNGQFDELKELLNKFLDADKENINQVYQFAVQAQKQGKYKLAIEYYKILMEYQPENSVVLNNLAWLYSLQNNPKALSLAKKAYNLKPKSPAIADTYGVILLKHGKVKQGLKVLENAAATAPEMKGLQFHLAKAYYLNNINDKAIKILENITKSEDTFAEKDRAISLLKKIK